MIYLRLFWEYFKTGLFAIGGGLATVPFLQDIAAKTGWYTSGELADMIAVSESTPGPMGVNMATYVGYTVGSQQGGALYGILGSVVATLGLITPCVIIILVIAYFLKKFRDSKLVNNTLYGLRPASVAMISAAGVDIVLFTILGVDGGIFHIAEATVNFKTVLLAAAVLICTRWVPQCKKLHPIWFIAASAVAGIVFQMSV